MVLKDDNTSVGGWVGRLPVVHMGMAVGIWLRGSGEVELGLIGVVMWLKDGLGVVVVVVVLVGTGVGI